jgi:hypothetical protein
MGNKVMAKPKKSARPGAKRKKVQKRTKAMRAGSKQEKVIILLRRSQGATIEEMQQATGWQAHSVRGIIAGVLKKKLGHAVEAKKEERGRVYRIAGAA